MTERITTFVKWKSLDEFPEYKISSNGLLMKNGVLQNTQKHFFGKQQKDYYLFVNIYFKVKNSLRIKKCYIHRLVWDAFGDNKDYKPLVIDHINDNPIDNRIENLILITSYHNLLKGRVNNGEITQQRMEFLLKKRTSNTDK